MLDIFNLFELRPSKLRNFICSKGQHEIWPLLQMKFPRSDSRSSNKLKISNTTLTPTSLGKMHRWNAHVY